MLVAGGNTIGRVKRSLHGSHGSIIQHSASIIEHYGNCYCPITSNSDENIARLVMAWLRAKFLQERMSVLQCSR